MVLYCPPLYVPDFVGIIFILNNVYEAVNYECWDLFETYILLSIIQNKIQCHMV